MKITIRDVEHYVKVIKSMDENFNDGWGFSSNVLEKLMYTSSHVETNLILDDEKEEDSVVLMCVLLL